MIKGENVLNLTHEQWLEKRKEGIGGSDAAAIAGLNKWKSAASVYIEKVETKGVSDYDNERMRIGRDLEDYVAHRFEEATGKKVRRNNFMLHHDEYPYMFADIDREVVGENAILECKTTGSYGKKEWAEEPPINYQVQCLHYMMVTGAERAYIACLIGNEAFVWYTIERDEETILALMELEKAFWENNVLKHECPAPDGSSDYDELLADKFPTDNGEEVALGSGAADILEQLDEVTAQIKEAEKLKKELQQNLKRLMGDASVAWVDERKITWKTQSRTSIDSKRLKAEKPEVYEAYSKTSESRVFKA